MISFLQQLFDTSGFPARWHCGTWTRGHGWLHIVSDVAIFGAYAAIPLALTYFIRRRKDVPFIPIFWLFAVFIFSCGFGHLIEATIFWHPWYRFSGLVKGVTAVVSWFTVIGLVKVLPGALALPGLAKINRQLKEEVAERQRAEEQFRQLNTDLEQRVIERTEAFQHTNEQLKHKAAELALISKYKSDFLANMSHELRTPLNSILILSQQLAENKPSTLNTQQVEFARSIHSSGSDLLNLITDILDLSKIESGTVSVEAEELSFAKLRESMERSFRHVAEAKSLSLNLEFHADLPRAVVTDPKRLHQILRNLLANAFKFTAQGSVSLCVRLASKGWSLGHSLLSREKFVLAFTVTDTGIGVAPEKQQIIFEAFQQADAGTSRKYGGTGLGLTISRELAALLGGEICLVSRPGQGSSFTLYLPLTYSGPAEFTSAPTLSGLGARPNIQRAREEAILEEMKLHTMGKNHSQRSSSLLGSPSLCEVEPNLAEDNSPSQSGPDDIDDALRGRRVLVVDDDARNIFALSAVLEDHHMEVLSATTGQRAIEIIRNTPDLDLVLMDIMMPDMDGYQTMREIRKESQFHALPILALTAKAMIGDRERCLEAGASDYIAKPVNTDQLLSRLRDWIGKEEEG